MNRADDKEEVLVALGADVCWVPHCRMRATHRAVFFPVNVGTALYGKVCSEHAERGDYTKTGADWLMDGPL